MTDRNKRLYAWLELMEERCEEAGVPEETLCVDTLAQRRADLRALLEENHKFMWQVRDTCARAEKAEAALALIADASPPNDHISRQLAPEAVKIGQIARAALPCDHSKRAEPQA